MNQRTISPDTIQKYQQALQNIPTPGDGCHTSLLSVANYGIAAGIDPETIFEDIRGNIPSGARHIPDKEISDAVDKAMSDFNGGTFTPKPRPSPIVKHNLAAWETIRKLAPIKTEADLMASSPVALGDEADPRDLFEYLFNLDDILFIGDRQDPGIVGETIRTALEWYNIFRDGGKAGPFIIINPLTGQPGAKKSGDGQTLRGDGCVKDFRYCLVEFDTRSRGDQVAFWSWLIDRDPALVMCLIDSGNKSIHGWLNVQRIAKVNTLEDWQAHIKVGFYGGLLAGLGVDTACSNPARLSRMPGFFREDKNKFQKLLWLQGVTR